MAFARTEVKHLTEIVKDAHFLLRTFVREAGLLLVMVNVWHNAVAKHEEPCCENKGIAQEEFHVTKLDFYMEWFSVYQHISYFR